MKGICVEAEGGGGWGFAQPSSGRDGRIYRLAVPVFKKILNLVILRRSRAGTAKLFTKRRDARAELLFC